VQAFFARNIVIGLGRVEGQRIGIVANQPIHLAGCLDLDAAEKAARFVALAMHFPGPSPFVAPDIHWLVATLNDGAECRYPPEAAEASGSSTSSNVAIKGPARDGPPRYSHIRGLGRNGNYGAVSVRVKAYRSGR